MKRSALRPIVWSLVVPGLLGLTSAAEAGRLFLSHLDGGQQVPAVESPASGHAETYLRTDQTGAHIHLVVEGMVHPIVAAHVHYGPPGVNGPMLFDLGAFTDSVDADFGPLSPTTLAAFLAGNLYVNVHTDVYLAGEIRGQLDPQPCRSFLARLDGFQEVPPTGSSATGLADLTLWGDAGRLHLDLSVRDFTHAVTDAHIHRAPRGQNGPVVFAIGSFAGRVMADFAPTSGQVQDLEAGLLYVNVHSDLFPGGEIRGQIEENTPASVGPAADRGGSRGWALEAAPNPAWGGTAIRWSGLGADVQPATGSWWVEIFDPGGRRVRSLKAADPPGKGGIAYWDGRGADGRAAPAGTYFARLRGMDPTVTPARAIARLTLLR